MSFAVVTGANRGIGLEITKQLKSKGHSILAVCRKPSEELSSLGVDIISDVDVSKESDLLKLKSKLGGQKIDLLINNAGIMRNDSINSLDTKTVQEQFVVNAVAPLKVVSSLLSNLSAGSKVAMITSRMGSINDNTSGGKYGYRMSKAALNAGSVSLAVDLQPKDIAVAIIHPGWVKTDMTNQTGLIDTKTSVNGILKIVDELNLKNSGSFWHTNGEKLSW